MTELGDVTVDFTENGDLVYTIHSATKIQIIKLRYDIQGLTIVTDQPSVPRIERTSFSLSKDGVLTLEFDGVPYRFRRQPDAGHSM